MTVSVLADLLKREWMPIESAPRDGTRVLVADASAAGSWVEAAYYDPEAYGRGGWLMVNTSFTDAHDGEVWPTVWMPFPDPPKLAETHPVPVPM